MSDAKSAKSRINLICGIMALICVAAMFVPIGQERGHFDHYGEVLTRGEAPYYIDHVINAPGGEEVVPYVLGMLAVFAAAILLLMWAFNSFKGRKSNGLAAAIINLLLSVFTLMWCMSGVFDGNPTLPVVFGLVILAVAALVLAILQRKAAKQSPKQDESPA